MSLAKIMKAAALPITTRHERWLAQGDPVYSQAAIDHAVAVYTRTVGGQRAKRTPLFRASGAGQCLRKRMFSRLQVGERVHHDTRLQNIFNEGNAVHLRWQMAGLTEGWLSEAEVPADRPDLHIGTTLDGLLWDGSSWEHKSINDRGFGGVTTFGPDRKHVMQMHYGFKAAGIVVGSITYENKNTQDWVEYRVHLDPDVMADVDRELEALIGGWESKSLPPMLPKCVAQEGAEWKNCPFRDLCPLMTTWKKAVAQSRNKELAA